MLVKLKQFSRSIWLFPVLLLIPLFAFTTLKISGSSVGVFHKILYGDIKDPDLLANQPEPVRSDEWLVTTQQTIAQSKSNFPRVNHTIGNGQDVSTQDVPYKDWSVIFKPQNLVFFILPLENAFAFKWWFMAYLLIISCYFFILKILPKKRLLAASFSIALFFSAFVQWWYAYGTLSPIYYSLFIATAVMYLFEANKKHTKILLSFLITYLLACFALVLYPPFQISCGIVLFTFLIGYMIKTYKKKNRKQFFQNIMFVAISGFVALAIVGTFIVTRADVVKTIMNTSYPGHRSLASGEFFPMHFMSSHLGYQFTTEARTGAYLIDGKARSNQSETSNFLLLTPFLLIPSLLLIYTEKKLKQPIDWPLLFLNLLFVVFVFHLFVHAFTPLSKLFLLNQVGGSRLLIGVGLLNIMLVILFIRNLESKKYSVPNSLAIGYSLLVLVVELAISLYTHHKFPFFIGLTKAVLFSLPIPLIILLLLKKYFVAAAIIFMCFAMLIGYKVNPLYKGLAVITKNPISVAISQVGLSSDETWAVQGGYLESIVSVNGEPSLSGVYNYPQLGLWDEIPDVDNTTYNRYAHVGTQITDDPTTKTQLDLLTADSFILKTSDCSQYLKDQDVGYVLTAAVIHGQCTEAIYKLSFPQTTIYIYKLRTP